MSIVDNNPVFNTISHATDPAESSLLVSVIIPVFNDQSGINACLNALLLQNYPHSRFEVIVVDNASTNPVSVDPAHAGFAKVIACASPGAYAARNAGIAVAKGDILAFTDADCIPDSNWISAGITALLASHIPCIIGGEVKMRLSPQPSAVELYQYLTGFMQQENIDKRGFTATANLFVFRDHLNEIGLFDETLLSGGDREWSWRAANSGYRVVYAADTIVTTKPRNSLAAAGRQARRVAGGRFILRSKNRSHITAEGLKPHRKLQHAVSWILFHPELSPWNRLRVFYVASILFLVQMAETIKLTLGYKPERR